MKSYYSKEATEAEKNIPNDMIASDLADFLKNFADMTRIKILYALLNMELCVHDLALMLNMEQSAISHHIRTNFFATFGKKNTGFIVFNKILAI